MLAGGKEQQRNKALTDNQRRAIPHAVLIDIVITQERSAYRLQERVHEILFELENLGALNYAVLRQGYLVHRRVGFNERKNTQFAEGSLTLRPFHSLLW